MRGREDQAEWAMTEFAAAARGAPRRTRRLIDLAPALADHPSAALPDAGAAPARRTAADRVDATAACPPAALLARHVQAT